MFEQAFKNIDDLRYFVNQKLFPHLHGFKLKASGRNTIEHKIGEIKISSGDNLRENIDHIDELRFRSQSEKHELSHLYEARNAAPLPDDESQEAPYGNSMLLSRVFKQDLGACERCGGKMRLIVANNRATPPACRQSPCRRSANPVPATLS